MHIDVPNNFSEWSSKNIVSAAVEQKTYPLQKKMPVSAQGKTLSRRSFNHKAENKA
jgi:hypothetical protein